MFYPLSLVYRCLRYYFHREKLVIVNNEVDRPELSIAYLDSRVLVEELFGLGYILLRLLWSFILLIDSNLISLVMFRRAKS